MKDISVDTRSMQKNYWKYYYILIPFVENII